MATKIQQIPKSEPNASLLFGKWLSRQGLESLTNRTFPAGKPRGRRCRTEVRTRGVQRETFDPLGGNLSTFRWLSEIILLDLPKITRNRHYDIHTAMQQGVQPCYQRLSRERQCGHSDKQPL